MKQSAHDWYADRLKEHGEQLKAALPTLKPCSAPRYHLGNAVRAMALSMGLKISSDDLARLYFLSVNRYIKESRKHKDNLWPREPLARVQVFHYQVDQVVRVLKKLTK
jgi:hypothetical protein